MNAEDTGYCKAIILVLLTIPATVLFGCSFHRLHTNEVGLDYNTFLERVSTKVYEQPGLHMLGLTHVFLRFPRTVLTVQYNEEEQDILHTRTADGLPVTLGLSFQWRYDTQRAHELYMTFGDSYLQVLDNSARSIIANVASNYSAYRFFSDKQGIAAHMQHVLDERMSSQLFASVDALQIETIELPSKFQDAILESIKVKQNIQAQLKYKENMMVTWEQDVMVAEQLKNQTITLAHGEAAKIHESAAANAIITNATIDAEISAYSSIAEALGFSVASDDLLTYIWWESQHELSARGKSAYMFGVEQGVYVAGGRGSGPAGPSAPAPSSGSVPSTSRGSLE